MNKTDLYCDVLRGRHLSQEWLNREFGARVGSMLGFGVALVGAGAIVLNTSQVSGIAPVVIFAVLFGGFALTAVSSVPILGPRDWRYGPKTSDLTDLLGEYEDHEVTRVTGDIYGRAVEQNQKVLRHKAKALWTGIAGLMVETIALAVLAGLAYWPTA